MGAYLESAVLLGASIRKVGGQITGVEHVAFAGGVHVQNLLMSARASVQWLVRSKVQEAQCFIQKHQLPTKCAAPSDLDQVLDDPRYI